MKKIILENKTFSSDVTESTESKFNGMNALGFSWRPGNEEFSLTIKSCTIDGSGVAEGLKLSFCKNVEVIDSTIVGGYEDCVDIVRGENIKFKNCNFISKNKTKQHITCKCGAKNVTFENCNFVGSFRNWWNGACIDLGNWGDYDDVKRPKVRNVSIVNCKLKNVAFPILYRRLYSNTPTVKNSNGFGLKVPNIFVKAFWFLQRKELVGKRRRFPDNWLKVYDFEL